MFQKKRYAFKTLTSDHRQAKDLLIDFFKWAAWKLAHSLLLSLLLCLFQGGMCWVKLNVFYLEDSLQDLAHKFGNISSNRKDISIFIQMFQELRFNMDSVVSFFFFSLLPVLPVNSCG